jgi:hypothetical protein
LCKNACRGRYVENKVEPVFGRLLDTSAVALLAHVLYWYAVTNYGDYEVLLSSEWSAYMLIASNRVLHL